MKVLDRGHRYELSDGAILQFIKRQDGELIPGTTNEELLEVLIDRTKFFQENELTRCDENESGIRGMAKALYWFCLRTLRREQQGVASTDLPHVSE